MDLDFRSEARLAGVHPALVRVIRRAAADIGVRPDGLGFIVTEGVRTKERQAQLVKAGASRTMNSRHIPDASGYGHAVDLAATIGKEVHWDWPLYDTLAKVVKQAAADCGVRITWGGDWATFRDGPHFEIAPGAYP